MVKESACSPGDLGLIPELGRSPGEENGYPFQCPGLENSMDRGAWQATVHGVKKRWTRPSDFHYSLIFLTRHRTGLFFLTNQEELTLK